MTRASTSTTQTENDTSKGGALNLTALVGGLLGGIGALTLAAFFIGYYQGSWLGFFHKRPSSPKKSSIRRRSKPQEDEEKVKDEDLRADPKAEQELEKNLNQNNDPEIKQPKDTLFLSFIKGLLPFMKSFGGKRSKEQEEECKSQGKPMDTAPTGDVETPEKQVGCGEENRVEENDIQEEIVSKESFQSSKQDGIASDIEVSDKCNEPEKIE
jgi:hypothetical protein